LIQLLKIPQILARTMDSKIQDMINNESVMVLIQHNFPEIAHQIDNVIIVVEDQIDCLIWKHNIDGSLNAKFTFLHLKQHVNPDNWGKIIWQNYIHPSHLFIFWRFNHSRLLTDDNLWGIGYFRDCR